MRVCLGVCWLVESLAKVYAPILAKSQERMILPKEGESKDECGTTKYIIGCSDDGCDYPRKLVPHTCNRAECPVCSDNWRKRAANRLRDNVWNTLLLAKRYVDDKLTLSSVVFSVPPDLYGLDYDDICREFGKKVKLSGALAVASIFHCWRYRDVVTGSEMESVSWKVFSANKERYERVWSPHFHCIVLGKLVVSSIFYRKTDGWVYHKLRNKRRNTYVLDRRDVFRIVFYGLSHVAISLDKRRQYIRYYGLFRKSKVVDENVEYEQMFCDKCVRPLKVTYVKFTDYSSGTVVDGLVEDYYKKIVKRIWALRVNGTLLDYEGKLWDG